MADSPNLLVIHTDEQSCWTLSAYGGTLIHTPHIDSLADEGAILTNFMVNVAVCTPSRGVFLTGRYEHVHGAYRNNIPLDRDEITFAQALKDRGYETGYAGKWHLDGTPRPGWVHPERTMGFDDAEYMFNRGHWKKIEDATMGDMQPTAFNYKTMGDEKTYPTDWLTEKTCAFLTRDRERPFCFMLSIPDPHPPFTVRPPYDTMYDPAQMPLPETRHEENRPSWVSSRQAPNDDVLRKHTANYCGMVKLIDDCVGKMLDALREKGILDNTIVVFTSDHGEYLGEHGLMGKNQLYETAYRVPMLIRWPEKIAPGTRVDQLVGSVDFMPTILTLMGFEPRGREHGRDASGLLRGDAVEWDDVCYIHHDANRAGVFTPNYELAYVKGHEAILFDRENDPLQVNNLFDAPEHSEMIAALTAALAAHHASVNSPAAAWLREKTTT